jgi:ubiquitin-conjugating enzyme E2 R
MSAERLLMNEFKALSKEPWTNVELINDNVFEWSIALIVLNPESLYYGGYFKAKMTFPKNYPYSPPDFKFVRPLYHPNIYPDGRLCISILHAPGDDEMSGELAAERWSPVQRVETVLISVLSLLDDAEASSPANVDAGVMYRNNPAQYQAQIKRDLETSKQDIPAGYVMPTHEAAFRTVKDEDDYNMNWEDSDVESFGGSDSEMDDDEDMDSDSAQEEEEEDDSED